MLTDDMRRIDDELRDFIVDELASAHGIGSFGPDEDLIRLGIIDSLGMQQLVDFCETRYAIRVEDADLLPDNFQTLRQLAAYIERKRDASFAGESRSRLRR